MTRSEKTKNFFTMVNPEGLFTPRRIPPGVLNATGYLQVTKLMLPRGKSTIYAWCGWTTS